MSPWSAATRPSLSAPGAGRYPAPAVMPKMKSHSGAKKRFKKTATGKLQGRHAFSSHILEKKSPKRKRAFSRDVLIAKADRKTVTKLLGGNGR
jgi:large subunit ribosomal protein L35